MKLIIMSKCRLHLVTLLWGWSVWYLNSTFKGFTHRNKHPELLSLLLRTRELLTVSHALLTGNLDKVQCPIMREIYPGVSSITETIPKFLIGLSLQPQGHPKFKHCASFSDQFLTQTLWRHMFLDRVQHISISKLHPSPDTYTRGSTVLDFSFLLSL